MTLTAIVLVLLSSLIHAGWNLLGKRDSADAPYFRVAATAGFLVMLPLLFVWRETVMLLPSPVPGLLLATGVFQGLYFIGLAGAYRRGELSLAYPVARALPVLLVPLFSAGLGTGSVPSRWAMAGIVTVVAGLLVISRNPGAPGRLLPRRGGWGLFALLAGIGTTGYSIIDDAAISLYRSALVHQSLAVRLPFIYSGLQSASTVLFLFFFEVVRHRVARGRWRVPCRELAPGQVRSAAISGLAIIGAYCLVLAAYGFASNVGYVVAFRQMSLPIGTALGVLVLGERLHAHRLAGTALILIGLVMVGYG
ncbi:MAG: hypothetical protein EA427_07085 [Spirochaetaceae bacterium]|nr:MAG: hypothetical protein EA427_07085 [Spirochaetaceae bacterium]